MQLNKISLKDKEMFKYYLGLNYHCLSMYSFENIYIWSKLYDILWLELKNSLMLFFQNKQSMFMYIDLLSLQKDLSLVEEAFGIMNKYNKNRIISRIENIEESQINFYKEIGFKIKPKFPDYLYLREDLVRLTGKKFSSQRNLMNYFLKNYKFKVFRFTPDYKMECLKLYQEWSEKRKKKYSDKIYSFMLDENFITLDFLLANYRDLDFQGWLVEVNNRIRAFSLGYPLNKDTFCILYEVVDLNIKGLAQFIFWFFCKSLISYKYINTLDDSGLENLKYTKLSYHPIKLIPNFIVTQNEN